MRHKITIVGLGNYGLDELPLGIYKFLQQQTIVYTRTKEHPVINELSDLLTFYSFDDIYEANDTFEAVYEEIVQQLVSLAQEQEVVYAVPGHPRVAETTTTLLLDYAQKHADLEVEVLGGKSFIDDVFEAVAIDPNDGFTLLDATSLVAEQLNKRNHVLVTQVYSSMVAGDLKVTLMEIYQDDHEVYIVNGARGKNAQVIATPLYELDHHIDGFTNLSSVLIPKDTESEHYYSDFKYATDIIDRLVDDNDGCPWDRTQTHDSLKRYLLEESFELFEAIDNEDDWHMIEELGDILLQVLLHASIGKKEGYFDINEIVYSLVDKMIRRHPHIFGDQEAENIEDLNAIWADAKAQEGKKERVKFEKVFAQYFLKMYDKTKNMTLDEEALRRFLEQGGENDETR
ncbi:nucleotide pyrophosphohydrolase [Staphylococcus sp. 18_1_E_LY]|uniref:Nucleotide pyrophosphohydrolase n=1 Tax=Staphylococcus lloydii TaxID=2781774 RepID=A0A7T1F9R0_9STAP|nr:MazG nucleotide pyrophosphohydrolase domain-containing protein [Staphylococcus lloydii]MBF7020749.1 nucleotide pyrophosphohydrolase [Staphylococcus lloydii]MBF7028432.1 nucleotide pyrophosphohydrolase [Staphylococcus lloydii]QPM74920.1 nucleotide pyrophosphohydrolase [Staphylococcus lloydii]